MELFARRDNETHEQRNRRRQKRSSLGLEEDSSVSEEEGDVTS